MAASDGFANLVILTRDHVVRLNDGRFPNAFRHEATVLNRLPTDIPHPLAVAFGTRRSGGEYLILERLPGGNLEQAWPSLNESDRVRIVQELGNIMKCLHTLPIDDWMPNPWVGDVLATKRWRDAYHAPPELYPWLVDSAAVARPELWHMLDSVALFVAVRMFAFEPAPNSFIHTDLHFRNVVVDAGRITGLIDFEGSRVGARDVELDMLLRSLAPGEDGSRGRHAGTIAALASTYPELFSSPHLIARLEAYEALWHLVQMHHWRPGQTWMTDPGQHLEALIAGRFRERIRPMLNEVNEQAGSWIEGTGISHSHLQRD
ncbi:MAG: phosphotransferase [Chloroflexota bacterium]|nr:phosphotransferase [Chloroflexota bacterium]